MAKTAVAKLEEAPTTAVANVRDGGTMLALLDRIMGDPSMPMERINQAFDFYQRVATEQARLAFDTALAAAQAEFPPITKNRHVKFDAKGGGKNTDYRHEDLAEIVEKCGPVLAKHGISRRWRTKNVINEPIEVTCILTHVAGHREETTLCGPRDDSGNKNSLQGTASTVTHLERYTFKSAIGMASKHDDDGNAAGAKPTMFVTDDQIEAIQKKIVEVGADVAKFLEMGGVESISDIRADQFQPAMDLLELKKNKRK